MDGQFAETIMLTFVGLLYFSPCSSHLIFLFVEYFFYYRYLGSTRVSGPQ